MYNDLVNRVGTHLRKIEIYALQFSLNCMEPIPKSTVPNRVDTMADVSCSSLLDQYDSATLEQETNLVQEVDEEEMLSPTVLKKEKSKDSYLNDFDRNLFYVTACNYDANLRFGKYDSLKQFAPVISFLQKRKVLFDEFACFPPKISQIDELYINPLGIINKYFAYNIDQMRIIVTSGGIFPVVMQLPSYCLRWIVRNPDVRLKSIFKSPNLVSRLF